MADKDNSLNMTVLVEKWKKESDQKYTIDRVKRMVYGQDTNQGKKKAADYFPKPPPEVIRKFTQNDTRLSDASKSLLTTSSKLVMHSNHNCENSGRSKLEDSAQNAEASMSNKSTKKQPMASIHEISFSNDEIVTQKPFNDLSNQIEKSLHDNQIDRAELMSANILSFQNNSFDLASTKQLNSTAILSTTNIKKTNPIKNTLPFTPIPQQKNTHKQLVDKTLISSYEEADVMFEKENVHNSKTFILKPKNVSTFNSSENFVSATKRSDHSHNKKPQEKKTPQNQFDDNHQTKKNKHLQSRKSLDFKNSGPPQHLKETHKISEVSDENEPIHLINRNKANKTKSILMEKTRPDNANEDSEISDDSDADNSEKNNHKLTNVKSKSEKESNKSFENKNIDDKFIPTEIKVKSKIKDQSELMTSDDSNNDSSKSLGKMEKRKSINKNTTKSNESVVFKSDTSKNLTLKNNKSDTSKNLTLKNNKSRKLNIFSKQIEQDFSDSDNESCLNITSKRNKPKTSFQSASKKFITDSDIIEDEDFSQSKEISMKDSKEKKKVELNDYIEESFKENLSQSKHNYSNYDRESVVEPEPNQIQLTAAPKPVSGIYITRITKNMSNNPSNDTIDGNVLKPVSNDVLDKLIGNLSENLLKQQQAKIESKEKVSKSNEKSLNQTDSELKLIQNDRFIRKSYGKSINSTANSLADCSTRSNVLRKTGAELKTPLLSTTSRAKSSFVLPPVPTVEFRNIDLQAASDDLNNKNKSQKKDTTQSEDEETLPQVAAKPNTTTNDLGFSNIEPADMFSPSASLNHPNEDEEQHQKKGESTKEKAPVIKDLIKKKSAIKQVSKKDKKSKQTKASKNRLVPSDDEEKENNLAKKSKTKSQSQKAKPLETISNGFTARSSQPIGHDKQFQIRRKTLQPVEINGEEESGLRRSKRVKIDYSSAVPVYQWESITDFTGKKLMVQTIVAQTKRTCRLVDFLNEYEQKKNTNKTKLKKSKPSRILRPKRDLSDSDENSDGEEFKRMNKKSKTSDMTESSEEINSMDQSNMDKHSTSNIQSKEPIHIKMNVNSGNFTETSFFFNLNSDMEINESQQSMIFEEEETSKTERKQVIYYANRVESVEFNNAYEGVSIKALSSNNGYICLEPEGCTRTQVHETGCEYFLQKGICLISIGGNISKIKRTDLYCVPADVPYKIKNFSSTQKAYLYFRFV